MPVDKIGRLIKRLYDKRNERRVAEEVVKKLKTEYDEISEELISILKTDNLESARHEGITVSVKESTVASVTDWDKVYRYIHRNNAYHLLMKRILDAPFREEMKVRKGKDIPGVEKFTKTSLNMSAPKHKS